MTLVSPPPLPFSPTEVFGSSMRKGTTNNEGVIIVYMTPSMHTQNTEAHKKAKNALDRDQKRTKIYRAYPV